MDLKKLELVQKRPPLYEMGDSIMWTDEYISKQLLEIHLNPEIDLASRTENSIEKTIEFIVSLGQGSNLSILDLGCGPGLYAERLAEAGHHVTGVDFSETSIAYASNQARTKNLDIDYICKDYLTIDYQAMFDLVLLIYTDFGVLNPDGREMLLHNIHRALKPNGVFIFDVINKKNLDHKFQESKSWTYENSGFWKNSPYLELINGFHYSEEDVFLQQHTIIDQAAKIRTYRFWTHYFDPVDINEVLSKNGFTGIVNIENVLPGSGPWSGENITFYKAKKQ